MDVRTRCVIVVGMDDYVNREPYLLKENERRDELYQQGRKAIENEKLLNKRVCEQEDDKQRAEAYEVKQI